MSEVIEVIKNELLLKEIGIAKKKACLIQNRFCVV